MKSVAIFGSTGSIGKNALLVMENLKQDFNVLALSCNQDADLLAQQALKFHPRMVNIIHEAKRGILERKLHGKGVRISTGEGALCEIAENPEVDLILNGITGSAGFRPTLAAVKKGKRVALANKETLVSFGTIIMREAKQHNAEIIPVDSEHSAIFQCIQGRHDQKIKRIILTTSGGPFRNRDDLNAVTIEEALNHPVWSMGKKITVNSATMMNKALEIIEAHFLFDVPAARIAVLIHPQCIVHSAVEFEDNSLLAQLSQPDMTLPIQYALTYPERKRSITEPLDLSQLEKLTFEPAPVEKYPALSLAYRALERGGTLPAVLNASNEMLVDAFLDGLIPFDMITRVVDEIMEKHVPRTDPSIEEIEDAEKWARDEAKRSLRNN
jgi:1-deoxy-D-xylulose-5-phosphate reductoisomerase